MVFGFFGKTWNFDQIPDLTGKVALVTGGNSGLGYISCLELARKNAKVYMACRNKSKAEEAIKKIKEALKSSTPSSNSDIPFIEFIPWDLSVLSSGKSAAEIFLSKENRLDILLNNAGIMATPYELSPEGIELQACNGIGHFALTIPLLPILKKTDLMPNSQVRIVNLSSIAHQTAHYNPDFSSLTGLNRDYSSTWIRYSNSKLSNILFNNELQKRLLQDTNIHCIAVHPGVVDTDLFKSMGESYPLLKPFISMKSIFRGTLFISPEKGAVTQLYAATSPEITEKKLKGCYLVPYGQVATPTKLAQDSDGKLSLQFWNLCETLVESTSKK